MSEINRWRGREVPLRNTLLYFGEATLRQSQPIYQARVDFSYSGPKTIVGSWFTGPLRAVDFTSQFEVSDFYFNGQGWYPTPETKLRMESLLKDVVMSQFESEEFMIPRCGPPVACVLQTGEDTMGDVSYGRKPTGDDIVINPCRKVKISFTADHRQTSTRANTPKVIFGSVGSQGSYYSYVMTVHAVIPEQIIGGDSGCPLDFYFDIQNELRNILPSTDSSVFQKAYEKAHGNAMELLVTTIEAAKTGAYISSKLMQLARLLVSVKKKAISGLFEKRASSSKVVAKATASAWLQFRYAIMPLVLDIQGAITASNKSMLLATIIRGFAKTTDNTTIALRTARTYGGVSASLDLSGDVLILDKAVAYGEVRAIQNREATRFNRIYGTTQLFSTAWELVPWSFVIDWFFNVGTYLKNITPLTGYNFVGYSHTLINIKTISGSVVIGSGNRERVVNVNCSVSLYDRRPKWGKEKVSLTAGNGLNPTRVADAISLIINKVL